MAILVLCLKPQNLLDPNPAFVSFGNRLTISPVVERLVFSKVHFATVMSWNGPLSSLVGVPRRCTRALLRQWAVARSQPQPSAAALDAANDRVYGKQPSLNPFLTGGFRCPRQWRTG